MLAQLCPKMEENQKKPNNSDKNRSQNNMCRCGSVEQVVEAAAGQALAQAIDARGRASQPGSVDPSAASYEAMGHLMQQYASQGGKQLKVWHLPSPTGHQLAVTQLLLAAAHFFVPYSLPGSICMANVKRHCSQAAA